MKKSSPKRVIEVQNLKKYYGATKALDGISLHVLRGEVFTLLGPNGAGKTTALEILEGLKEPDSGKMIVLNRECQRITPDIKDRIGVVLQDTRFLERIRVHELITTFASFFSRSLPVEAIIEMVSLEEKKNDFVENLSGGQRQRLAIGIALVNDPEIVFMDEPTTGLDPQARRNIWELILSLKNQQKTIFLTTHYMEEAEELSDYIYIMDHGRIIDRGTPRELTARLGQENIIEFSTTGLSKGELKELKEKFEELSIRNERCLIFTENLTALLSSLLNWAAERSIEFNNLTFRQPNLEDVFLSLTGKELRD